MVDDKAIPQDKKMMNGGLLALFIIGGGILGDLVVWNVLAQISGLGGIFILVVFVLLFILYYLLNTMKGLSTATYAMVLACCMILPLFGGVGAYILLRRNALAK